MSRSKKDGAHGGGHKDWLCREFWSRRWKSVNGLRESKWGKVLTHRFERRQAKRMEREAVRDVE